MNKPDQIFKFWKWLSPLDNAILIVEQMWYLGGVPKKKKDFGGMGIFAQHQRYVP